MHKVVDSPRFELPFCLTLVGFKKVTPTIALVNGITLVPAPELPSYVFVDDAPVGAGLIKSVTFEHPLNARDLRALVRGTREELLHCAFALSLVEPLYISPLPVAGSVLFGEGCPTVRAGTASAEHYLDSDEQTLLGTKYTLQPELAEAAREVVGLFLSLPVESRRRYELALQRLADAKRRGTRHISSLYNCSLDLGIALESLLLPEDSHTDINYRVPLRVAKLISRDIDEQMALFDRARKLYNVRSKAAHGVMEVRGAQTPEKTKKLGNEIGEYKRLTQKAIISLIKAELDGTVEVGKAEMWKRFDLS